MSDKLIELQRAKDEGYPCIWVPMIMGDEASGQEFCFSNLPTSNEGLDRYPDEGKEKDK